MNNKEVVGNIRIKQPKTKKNKKSDISLLKKIFIWLMFIAMLTAFLGPLVFYFISVLTEG